MKRQALWSGFQSAARGFSKFRSYQGPYKYWRCIFSTHVNFVSLFVKTNMEKYGKSLNFCLTGKQGNKEIHRHSWRTFPSNLTDYLDLQLFDAWKKWTNILPNGGKHDDLKLLPRYITGWVRRSASHFFLQRAIPETHLYTSYLPAITCQSITFLLRKIRPWNIQLKRYQHLRLTKHTFPQETTWLFWFVISMLNL